MTFSGFLKRWRSGSLNSRTEADKNQRATATATSVEGARLEWNTFISIFENLEKKAAKSMQMHENKLNII